MKAEESESDHEGNGKTRCSKPSACLWLWWSQWQHGPASRSTDSVVTSIKAIFVIGSSWVEEDSIYVIELFFQAIMVDSTSWYSRVSWDWMFGYVEEGFNTDWGDEVICSKEDNVVFSFTH